MAKILVSVPGGEVVYKTTGEALAVLPRLLRVQWCWREER